MATLVGVRARNHPQQVGARGSLDAVDERITPDALWRPLDERFRFTIDVAASASNAKVARYFDLATNGLDQSWAGETVWCNPPYSQCPAWVRKAFTERERGGATTVLLLPANRTEQPWWQEMIEPVRDRGLGVVVTFLPRRINFGRPDNPCGKYATSSPFGCVLIEVAA